MTRIIAILLLLGSLCITNVACSQDREAFEGRTPQRVEEIPQGEPLNEEIMRSRETAITRAVAAVAPAVVSINVIELQTVRVRDPFFSDPWIDQFFPRRYLQREVPVEGLGSGFVISPDGYVVTNDHVAGRASRISVSFPDGQTLDARLVGTDPATDIALLK
ncbi:MAG TPA: trypsin-like peptidase domain-containing protein, partial [Rhodothermales bacterium]